MTPAEAKDLVKKHMDAERALGYTPTLADINECINKLKAEGFLIVRDGTRQVVSNVMFDNQRKMTVG